MRAEPLAGLRRAARWRSAERMIGAVVAAAFAVALVADGPILTAHPAEPAAPLVEDDLPRLTAALGGDAGAVAASGNRAYVSIGSRLVVLDITDASHAVQLGPGWLLGAMAEDIVLHQGAAYVRHQGGIQRIDLSAPDEPRCRMMPVAYQDSIALEGDTLYAVSVDAVPSRTTVTVLDLRDPLAPTVARTIPLETPCWHVAAGGGRLYLACPAENEIRAFALDEPAAPRPVDSIPIGARPTRIAVVDDRLWVVWTTSCTPSNCYGLRVFDLSDPAAPRPLGEVALSGPTSFAASGRRVAVTVADGVRLVEVSGVEPPRVLDEVYFSIYIPLRAIALAGDRLLVSTGPLGLELFAVSGTGLALRYDAMRTIQVTSVAVGRHVVYAAVAERVLVLDRSSPARLERRSEVVLPASVRALEAEDGWIYALTKSDVGSRVVVVDARQPDAPAVVAELALAGGSQLALVADHVLGVTGPSVDLELVDVRDPARPRPIGRFGEDDWTVARRGEGGFAYVADASFGVRVLNLADPSAPVVVAGLAVEEISHLDVDGDRLYVVGLPDASLASVPPASAPPPPPSQQRVLVLDVSDPLRPRRIGRVMPAAPSVAGLAGLAATQGRVCVHYTWYPRAFDERRASLAVLRNGGQVGSVPLSASDPTDMVAIDGMLYLANGGGGLMAIQLPGPAGSPIPTPAHGKGTYLPFAFAR